jgi:hypothetical protein
MKNLFRLCVLFPFMGIVYAQIGNINFIDMKPNQVVEKNDFLYIKLSATIRDEAFPLEKLLILRGENKISQWLCNYIPSQEKKLDAKLYGLQVIQSEEINKERHVLLRVKRQNPECKIILLNKNIIPAEKDKNVNPQDSKELKNSVQNILIPKKQEFKIEKYKLEY